MRGKVADPRKLLTLKTVQKQLTRLLFHFPGNGRTVNSLAAIAPDYLEAFKGLYNSEFIKLVDFAIQQKGRRFFPTIGELKLIESDLNNLHFAEESTKEFIKVTEKPVGPMSEKNKRLLADLLQKIGKDIE